MSRVAGVDGCKGGWFAVFSDPESGKCTWDRFAYLSEILNSKPRASVIAIDIPIGLLDRAEPGGRTCDREARDLLGQPRARSVFSPPIRKALRYPDNYKKALLENRNSSPQKIGISKQAHALSEKIREANSLPEAELKTRVYEVHPELCFFQMNCCKPLKYGKKAKQQAGIKERQSVLAKTVFGKAVLKIIEDRPKGVSKDDVLDALAACWTAVRISNHDQIPKSAEPPTIWR